MIFCEFCKISKDIFFFDRTPLDDCFLCLSVNSETIFRILLLQSTSGKLVFYLQVAEFKPPFIYLKPLKTVCEEVNLLWICLHFLRRHQFQSTISFSKCKRKVVLLVLYLFIQVNFLHVKLWHLTFSWGFSWEQFLSNKLEFFVSRNNIKQYYKDYKNILIFALCFEMYFFIRK